VLLVIVNNWTSLNKLLLVPPQKEYIQNYQYYDISHVIIHTKLHFIDASLRKRRWLKVLELNIHQLKMGVECLICNVCTPGWDDNSDWVVYTLVKCAINHKQSHTSSYLVLQYLYLMKLTMITIWNSNPSDIPTELRSM